MSTTEWFLSKDQDVRGHDRFTIIRRSPAFQTPTRVCMFSGWVSEGLAESVMTFLKEHMEENLSKLDQTIIDGRRRRR